MLQKSPNPHILDDVDYQIYKLSETPSATHSVSDKQVYVNSVPIDPPLKMTEISDSLRPSHLQYNFKEQTRLLGLHYLLPTVQHSSESTNTIYYK